MDRDTPEDLPLIYRDVAMVFEEFRLYALPQMGEHWAKTLPRVPLTREEVKTRLQAQLERDEKLVLRQLKDLGSESASIIIRLDLSRELIQAAMSILREDRPAQITLMTILGGTRFKYAYQGLLIPTSCPRMRGGERCNQQDSFDHLIFCYALQTQLKTGLESVPFLVTMARKATPGHPRRVRPMFLE